MKKPLKMLAAGLSAASMILAFTISSPAPVRADDFSYDAFLNQVLVPTYGFSPLGTNTRSISGWDDRNWDPRSGIITISQMDFNADGINDCLVYRISEKYNADGSLACEVFWLDLYSHDAVGTINLINSVEVYSDSDTGFTHIRTGLMSKQGQVFIYAECYGSAYFADGTDSSIYFYSYDGTSLRPYYWVGKSRGGSDQITYSYYEYTDAQNYNETILTGDSYAIPEGMQAAFPNATFDEAIIGGLKMIGLPDPAMEEYQNYGRTSSATFPTYFNTQILKKVYEYDAHGSGVSGSPSVAMSITLTDFTGINTNQLQQAAAQTAAAADPYAAQGTVAGAADPNAAQGTAAGAADPNAAQTGSVMPYGTGTALPGGTASGAQTAADPNAAAQGTAAGAADPYAAQTGQVSADAYLVPDSNSRYLSSADIANMTAQQLNYARNEIYARHGRMFNSVELQQFFATRSWYRGTVPASSFSETVFNSYETQNVQTLLAREVAITGRAGGMLLDQPGYDINAVWR